MDQRNSAAGSAIRHRRPRSVWLALLLVLLLPLLGQPTALAAVAASPPQAAAVTFQVTYAAEVPQEARDAFAASTAVWAPLLNSTVPIQVSVTWKPRGDCSQGCTLASAGPTDMIQNFPKAPRADTLYPIALANSLAGAKQNQGADIVADFNSQVNWYFGTGAPPTGRNSFISTAVHELAHGLGFSATLGYTGNQQGTFETPPNIYDRYVINGTGQTLIDSFANNSTALGAQLTSGAVYFGGPNAKQAAGGAAPKLFAPNPWQTGSSISHLDQATYTGGPNALMTPNDEGSGNTTPGPITEAILKDLGWPGSTASPSPSPSGCGQRFGDVPATNPACVAIEGLAARGVINGCDASAAPPLFCPNDPTLRHQMAALIVRAIPAWSADTFDNPFKDPPVPFDAELWRRVATLQHYSVVRGYQDEVCVAQKKSLPCYGPTDNVAYGQTLLFISRAMVANKYWALQDDDRTIFPDQVGAPGADPNTDQQTLDHRYIVTYIKNVGAPPDVANVRANFAVALAGGGTAGWGDSSPRAWFARALYPAIKDR